MKAIYSILLYFYVFNVSQTYADATVQFECTETIRVNNKNLIVQGVALNKAPEGKPGGFGFACLSHRKDEIQKAEIPAGSYNIRCVLAHKNVDRPDNIVVLDDKKNYYVTFAVDNNDLCTAKISEQHVPEQSLLVSEISKQSLPPIVIQEPSTPDSTIIKGPQWLKNPSITIFPFCSCQIQVKIIWVRTK